MKYYQLILIYIHQNKKDGKKENEFRWGGGDEQRSLN